MYFLTKCQLKICKSQAQPKLLPTLKIFGPFYVGGKMLQQIKVA